MFDELLERLGIEATNSGVCGADWHARPGGSEIASLNPSTGEAIARVQTAARSDYDRSSTARLPHSQDGAPCPLPRAAKSCASLGSRCGRDKSDLGLLVSLEVGKIRSEGEGEVQEMIDMCDFATGPVAATLRSDDRQRTPAAPADRAVASARTDRRDHGVQFPGRRLGVERDAGRRVRRYRGLETVARGAADRDRRAAHRQSRHGPSTVCAESSTCAAMRAPKSGQWLAADKRLPLISATGSCAMGRSVAATVGHRLGRTLLELGGNNGMIVTEDANLDLALRAVVFAAVGTTGQRCTTLRRLFVQESIVDDFASSLVAVYRDLPIGNPWEDGVLVGPLINAGSRERMLSALDEARAQGGTLLCGGDAIAGPGYFVEPASCVRARTCRSWRRKRSRPSCTS